METPQHTERKKWVVGFLFRSGTEVALVSKARPQWQAGKLNGIGGKIDEGETPLAAMTREFAEETGVTLPDWREFALLKVQDGDVWFFVAHGDHPVHTTTDEAISWYPVSKLASLPIVENLSWLVPLALDLGNKHTTIDYYQAASAPKS